MQCPICAKRFEPHQTAAMPFCSERCREVDLGRWLEEKYHLPDAPPENLHQPDSHRLTPKTDDSP